MQDAFMEYSTIHLDISRITLSRPCLCREVSQLYSGSFMHSAKRPRSPLCAVFSRRSPYSVMNKPQHTSRHQAEAFLPWPGACYLCKSHYGLENRFLSAFIFNVSPALSQLCCTCRHPLSESGCSPPLHARWPAPRRSRCRPPSTSTLILPRASGFVIPFSSV